MRRNCYSWQKRSRGFKIRADRFCIRCYLPILLFEGYKEYIYKSKLVVIKVYIRFALVAKVISFEFFRCYASKKKCRLTNTTNMIVKREILVKQTSRSLTLEKDDTCVL